MSPTRVLPTCILAAAAFAAQADVKLPTLFTEHMVLQQGKPLQFWGWADKDESVTVELNGVKTTVSPGSTGRWQATLPARKAGGPYKLEFRARNTIAYIDVMVGEVWICSGQSNMEWPLGSSFQAQKDIAASANPMIRLFTVPKLKAESPVSDVKGSWQVAGPDNVPGFSAVGYYFGRDLQKARGVAIGLIHTSWGGSPAEVWMREEVLTSNPRYKAEIMDTYAPQRERFEQALAAWTKESAAAKAEGKPFTKGRPNAGWRPAELYNGMIAPLIPYGIAGAIWYQGESNAGRAEQYRSLYIDMIRNWRADFGQGDFTFLGVQLAPYDASRRRSLGDITATPVESNWAELREAQSLSTTALPNVGLAVITDVGHKDDIHPTVKEPVGARLALAARKIAYKEAITASGPVYKAMTSAGGKIELTFDNVGSGLEFQGGRGMGFAICGEDRKWVWADAELSGLIGKTKVIVSSPQVPNPVAVRYGWSDFPFVNLWNRNGLPASPFRTDDFPMITAPKK